MSNEKSMNEFLKSVAGTHERDQIYAAMSLWGGALRHFFMELRTSGFTDEQAMQLTRDFLVTQLQNTKGGT